MKERLIPVAKATAKGDRITTISDFYPGIANNGLYVVLADEGSGDAVAGQAKVSAAPFMNLPAGDRYS